MKAIIDRLLQNGLEDLKGLWVEGEIPVSQDILNDLIKNFLENNTPAENDSAGNKKTTGNGFDIGKMLTSLDVKEIKIELKEKVAVIKVNIRKLEEKPL